MGPSFDEGVEIHKQSHREVRVMGYRQSQTISTILV